MLKYYLVFLCYLILKIDPGHCNLPCSTAFNYKEGYQWSCDNEVDGKAHVVYSCLNDGEIKEISLNLLFGDIPVNTQSLTIQNCEANLKIVPTVDIKWHHSALKDITKTKYEHFTKLAFKNITDLTMGPLLSGFQLIMNGNVSVSFEDVDYMRILPSALITSDLDAFKYYNSNMERLNFTMINVNIDTVVTEAIDWRKSDVPVDVTWKNVNVKRIETGAIKMQDCNEQYPLGKINLYPENNVYITNCSFDKLPSNVAQGLTKNFIFVNNRVADIEPSALNIISQNIKLSTNEFNDLHEFAFSSLYKGWLLENHNESSSVVSKYEQILLKNTDNICIDDEFKNLSASVQQFYHKYNPRRDSSGKHPRKPGSSKNPYIIPIVFVVNIVVIYVIIGFYSFRRTTTSQIPKEDIYSPS